MEYNFYREDSPWVDMTQLSWKMLTDGRTSKRFSKGHVFYNQLEFCENVFIIKHGRVTMNLCAPEGGMRTTTILDGGCIFGHQGIFDQKPNSCLAMVISDNAEVYVLPKEEMREKVRTDPDVALNILMQSNRINRMLLTQIELMSFQRSESRVCFFLLHMANQYSIDRDEQQYYQIRFTHQDIADITGLSRVCVSNTISGLVKDGILLKNRGAYQIVKPELLKERIRYS